MAIRSKPLQRRPRSYRVEKRLVHVTPHPVHTPLFVGPGQGMASLAEMLSGVLVFFTCRNSPRNHTAGTSEALATSLQALRIPHTPRMRDRCQLERGEHGNTFGAEL